MDFDKVLMYMLAGLFDISFYYILHFDYFNYYSILCFIMILTGTGDMTFKPI